MKLPQDHKVVDVFVLLILHATNRKKAVESLVRNKIRAGCFTDMLLQTAFKCHSEVSFVVHSSSDVRVSVRMFIEYLAWYIWRGLVVSVVSTGILTHVIWLSDHEHLFNMNSSCTMTWNKLDQPRPVSNPLLGQFTRYADRLYYDHAFYWLRGYNKQHKYWPGHTVPLV